MQLRLRSILLTCVLLTLFALVSEARADSIVITNGFIAFDSQSVNNTFSLQGDGFSMHGHTVYFYLNEDFLPPGGTFHTGTTLTGSGTLSVSIPYTVNGVTYNLWGSVNDSLGMVFSANSFVLPVDTSINSVSFTTPFTMIGHLSLISATNQRFDINGQGTANVVFEVSRENAWRLSTLTYTFNQPTPTPEPTTLLLLGTGIAGVAAKVYRRRKERK